MDFGLSALFRLLRICALSTGSLRRSEYAQRNQSQLQIRSDYLLSANNSDSIRVYFGFRPFQVPNLNRMRIEFQTKNPFDIPNRFLDYFKANPSKNNFFGLGCFLFVQFLMNYGLIVVDSNSARFFY